MVKIVVGNCIGKNGRLAVGCSAFVFDDKREKVLLVRRADDGKWCVPGGFMESGENFSEVFSMASLKKLKQSFITTLIFRSSVLHDQLA